MAVTRVIPRVPRYFRPIVGLLRDGCIPKRHRAVLLAALGYNVSPVDLVPGVIPVAGQLDDLGVLLLGLRWVLRQCEPCVANEHLMRSDLTMPILEDDIRAVSRTAWWMGNRVKALTVAAVRALVSMAGRAGRWTLSLATERNRRRPT